MSRATLQNVNDELTIVINKSANLSIEITSGACVLERQTKTGVWREIEAYSASTEDIIYSGAHGTLFRVRQTVVGSIDVEIW